MSNFPSRTVSATPKPVLKDYPAANARSQCHANYGMPTARDTLPCFANGRRICVILQDRR
jgi:hypothetical protein